MCLKPTYDYAKLRVLISEKCKLSLWLKKRTAQLYRYTVGFLYSMNKYLSHHVGFINV